jgi:hypothetical protein
MAILSVVQSDLGDGKNLYMLVQNKQGDVYEGYLLEKVGIGCKVEEDNNANANCRDIERLSILEPTHLVRRTLKNAVDCLVLLEKFVQDNSFLAIPGMLIPRSSSSATLSTAARCFYVF